MSKIDTGFGVEGVQFTDFPQYPHPDSQLKSAIIKRIAEEQGIEVRNANYVTGNNPLDCAGFPLASGVGKLEFGPATHYREEDLNFTTHGWGEIVNTKPLSEFQLDQIAKTFGLERSVSVATKAEESPAILPPEALPIRDGYVFWDEWIWWRNSLGPRQVQAGGRNDNWRNIQLFPEYYQWARPTFVDGKYVD